MSERSKIIKQKVPSLKATDLENLRRDLSITIIEMADIMGVSETSYHRIKSSNQPLSKERSAFILYLKAHFAPSGIKKIYSSAAKLKSNPAQ